METRKGMNISQWHKNRWKNLEIFAQKRLKVIEKERKTVVQEKDTENTNDTNEKMDTTDDIRLEEKPQ
eukprot:TRINITY_DN13539_c0_g1_i1.p2 TRINITY_DN13539_c0_g1~~TRINITY_DN13539_c0_g1_i1.p2  ORF type:complete len:68 (+),score=16.85 TRINITY_DN13539_c0_g1_i1:113-316(+)